MNKKLIKSLVFNVLEVYFIGLIGFLLNVPLNYITMLFLLFFISRFAFKRALHYKTWYLCALWSASLFITLFFLVKESFAISILATIFCAYVTSGTSNIEDMFMFKQKGNGKYKPLDDFIRYNYDDERLIKYENYLKSNDSLKYNLFKLRFRDNRSWEDIKRITDIEDTKKLTSLFDSMYETLKYNLMLED